MRLLVTGGRHYKARDFLWNQLDGIHVETRIVCIIQGGCPTGADLFARQWARILGVTICTFEAEWHIYGAAAGPIRNARMVATSDADRCIAFPGNNGTNGCVGLWRHTNRPLMDLRFLAP